MCGIAGELRFDDAPADAAAVERMAASMAPRGPDAQGLHAQGTMAFGHRRLRIIDLSTASAQPMVDPTLGLAIVFNGCIYNYRALRDDLVAKGYSFFSQGDTEVLLKAWHAPATVTATDDRRRNQLDHEGLCSTSSRLSIANVTATSPSRLSGSICSMKVFVP